MLRSVDDRAGRRPLRAPPEDAEGYAVLDVRRPRERDQGLDAGPGDGCVFIGVRLGDSVEAIDWSSGQVLGEGGCKRSAAVLMSDGFAELIDERGRMLGYGRAAEVLEGKLGLAPEALLRRFKREVEAWTGERGASDDVTLVVLQAKAKPR